MPHTMIDCTCQQCQETFQVTLSTFNHHPRLFCSRACQYQQRRDQADARFWLQVDKTSHPGGCWLWMGERQKQGYGRFFASGWHAAHRYAWKLKNGPILGKLQACHKCDNPPCCNPDHLFLGTALDNRNDMRAKGRGLKGHTYTDGRSRGEKNPKAKLTTELVAEIRAAYKGRNHKSRRNGPTLKELAAQYGMSLSVIHGIVTDQLWKDIS